MTKLTFQEAKDRFIKHGACDHDEEFHISVEPYKCGVRLTDCGVCGKRINLVYLN